MALGLRLALSGLAELLSKARPPAPGWGPAFLFGMGGRLSRRQPFTPAWMDSDLEQLADEYYEAQLLDPRRAQELQRDIVALVKANHIDRELQLEAQRSSSDHRQPR